MRAPHVLYIDIKSGKLIMALYQYFAKDTFTLPRERDVGNSSPSSKKIRSTNESGGALCTIIVTMSFCWGQNCQIKNSPNIKIQRFVRNRQI